jgi:hypothetical protein
MKLFPTGILAIAFFATMIGCSSKYEKSNRISYEKRSFQDIKLTEVEFENNLNDFAIDPRVVKSYKDHLFLLDFSDMTVKRFDGNGRFINNIGKGIGEGPGEHLFVMDFSFQDSLLYIADQRQSSITSYDLNGEYIHRRIQKEIPVRITAFEDVFITQVMGSDFIFQKTELENEESNVSFGKIIQNQRQNSTSIIGNFVKFSPLNFAYVPYYASKIYFGDKESDQLQLVNTLDNQEFPLSETDQSLGRMTSRAPRPDIVNLSADCSNGIIYIFVFHRDSKGDNHQYFIDRYEAENGTYINSYKMPFFFNDFTIFGDKIIIIRDGRVQKYQIELS